MRLVVSGAGGFIGRHVVAALQARGLAPVALLRPGAPVPAVLDGLEVVQLDITRAPADAFERLGRPDALIPSPGAGCRTTAGSITSSESCRGISPS